MGQWQQKRQSEASIVTKTLRKPATDVLNGGDKGINLTIHMFLQVLCTLLTSNTSAERSFSSLRQLKSWAKATINFYTFMKT